MENSDARVSSVVECLESIVGVGKEGVSILKNCLSLLHMAAPAEPAGVFSRIERIVSASDDLAWIILMVGRAKSSIDSNIKRIKDPEFTMLVRSGRPSTVAIESEIRMNHDEILEMEERLQIANYLEDYLQHIEKGLDRCVWMLRDKASYLKA